MHVDQSRVERKGCEVFVRVENDCSRSLSVDRFDLKAQRSAFFDFFRSACGLS